MRFWPKKKWKQVLLILFIAIIVAVPASMGYLSYANREPAYKNGSQTLLVTSPAFQNGEPIPNTYTAMGANINPPLTVQDIPDGTQSLAVIVYDPIVPGVLSWTHWVTWNLPVNMTISENTNRGVQGRNSWNTDGYKGPDPTGQRTYYFTVYALDTILDLPTGSSQGTVLRAMDNHVLAKGQMTGTSQK